MSIRIVCELSVDDFIFETTPDTPVVELDQFPIITYKEGSENCTYTSYNAATQTVTCNEGNEYITQSTRSKDKGTGFISVGQLKVN